MALRKYNICQDTNTNNQVINKYKTRQGTSAEPALQLFTDDLVAVWTMVTLLLSKLYMALLEDHDDNSAAIKLVKIIKVRGSSRANQVAPSFVDS